jgi:outer membrane protein assembly factor BamB
VVWYLDTDSGELVGLDAQTGSSRFTLPVGAVSHFASPAAGDGQIVVAAGGTVQAYAFG